MNPIDDQETAQLWLEMREDRAKETAAEKPRKQFETLPDGDYVGRAFIQPDKVSGENSPNYGRSKYLIKLNVTEGPLKGKMAYHHRVILPHYLANKPPATDTGALEEWKGTVKNYLKQTDIILSKCGVDTSDLDKALVPKRIAENNARNPIVNFTMKNGTPYINYLVNPPQTSDVLFTDEIPDGDDAPIK